ncbi:MAG: hypothetical protein IJ002_01265 [Clostridia bacterium]|nr:hypothetical protein [Clostridia bacterium]
MPRITEIDVDNASQEVKNVISEHLARGHRLTAEKRTLLHNVKAFLALEESSYALDDELQRLIGKRAADFYEYAISVQNDCLVCSAYFTNLLKKNNIDFETFDFTERENLLIEYGRAIAKDPKGVSDELFKRLKKEFTEEEIVVITTMGVLMIANNYLNDILQVQPEEIVD